MLAFFRGALSSKFTLGLLGLIMLAFIVTGVGTPASFGSMGLFNGAALATVSGEPVETTELTTRLQDQLKQEREKNPTLTLQDMVSGGAVDGLLDQMVSMLTLKAFGEKNGMVVSRRLMDGEIAGNPAFAGLTGQFSDEKFQQVLVANKWTEALFRKNIEQALMARHILAPLGGSAYVPDGYALTYSSMQLERRGGDILAIPSAAFAGKTPPTDAELDAYYKKNAALYTLPERRVIRYASFDRSRFEGKVTPTDAEIATFYKDNAERFKSRDKRGLTQIIVQDQAAAKKIADAARAGTAMAAAAKSSGVDALAIQPIEQAAYAAQSSAAVAKAVFADKQGAIVGPIKSGLGWHIVKLDIVSNEGGKTLEQAKPEILTEIAKVKVDEALQTFSDEIDEAVGDGQTFDDIVKSKALVTASTGEITASGVAPDQPGVKPDEKMFPLYKEAFGTDPEDDAAIVPMGEGKYIFFKVDKVIAAAPPALAKVKEQVAKDFVIDRGAKGARQAAAAILGKVERGTALAKAATEAGTPLPAPESVVARRIDLLKAGEKAPPALISLFEIGLNKAKLVEIPNKQGWYVIRLNSIEAGDAAKEPGLINETRNALMQGLGDEYSAQFIKALEKDVKVKRNADNVATFKRDLTGTTAK